MASLGAWTSISYFNFVNTALFNVSGVKSNTTTALHLLERFGIDLYIFVTGKKMYTSKCGCVYFVIHIYVFFPNEISYK